MDGGGPGRRRDESSTPPGTEPGGERDRSARLRLMALALQFGGTIVGSLVLFLGGGVWLDNRFRTGPLFLLIGLALAFVAIGYNLYELATVKTTPVKARPQPDRPPSPSSAAWDAWDERERGEDDEWPARRGAGGTGKEG